MYKIRKVEESPGSVMREWEVYWKDGNIEKTVASIPRYYRDPEAIAAGIAKLLNTGNIILPLNV